MHSTDSFLAKLSGKAYFIFKLTGPAHQFWLLVSDPGLLSSFSLGHQYMHLAGIHDDPRKSCIGDCSYPNLIIMLCVLIDEKEIKSPLT